MAPTTADLNILGRVLDLISRRASTYEAGSQTTVCWNSESGWLNSITRFQFIRKGEKPPSEIAYEYPNLHIIRRLLGPESTASVLKELVENQCLRLRDPVISDQCCVSTSLKFVTRVTSGYRSGRFFAVLAESLDDANYARPHTPKLPHLS